MYESALTMIYGSGAELVCPGYNSSITKYGMFASLRSCVTVNKLNSGFLKLPALKYDIHTAIS